MWRSRLVAITFVNIKVAVLKGTAYMSKIIYKSVTDWLRGEESIRIALVGSRYSGKTVFLTSLASQLLNHDEKNCPLKGWNVYDAGGTRDNGAFPDFKYADARRMLADGEWPNKTADCSVWRRHLKLTTCADSRPRVKRVYMEVMDLPGERVADLSMAGSSYREWCKWFEDSFGGVDGSTRNYGKYINAIKECREYDEIIAAYRRFVADELAIYALSVTPSIVKLDRAGNGLPECHTSDEFFACMKDRPLGFSQDLQFAPVPQSWFDIRERRNLVKKFQKGYDKYKKEIVHPIVEWLKSVNQVFYFVDILGLLARGPEVYNGELSFAKAVLNQFGQDDPNNRLIRSVSKVFSRFIKTSADGVYVVASKIDRVLPGKDQSNVENLAKRMLSKVLESLNVDFNVYTCAAVETTHPVEGGLQGRVRDKEHRVVECKYRVAPIPDDWPESDDWKVGNHWPETFPVFDKRGDKPPRQKTLERLVGLMLSIKA